MVVPVCHGEFYLVPYPLWPATRHYPSVLTQNTWPVALVSAMPKHCDEIQENVSFYCVMLILTVHSREKAHNFSSTEVD